MRFQWEILFVGEHGWIVAGREGLLKAYPAEILGDVNALNPSTSLALPSLRRLRPRRPRPLRRRVRRPHTGRARR
jgi:hypothetical protein